MLLLITCATAVAHQPSAIQTCGFMTLNLLAAVDAVDDLDRVFMINGRRSHRVVGQRRCVGIGFAYRCGSSIAVNRSHAASSSPSMKNVIIVIGVGGT